MKKFEYAECCSVGHNEALINFEIISPIEVDETIFLNFVKLHGKDCALLQRLGADPSKLFTMYLDDACMLNEKDFPDLEIWDELNTYED